MPDMQFQPMSHAAVTLNPNAPLQDVLQSPSDEAQSVQHDWRGLPVETTRAGAATPTEAKLSKPNVAVISHGGTPSAAEDQLDALDDGAFPFLTATGTTLSSALTASGPVPHAPALPVPQVATQIATALAQNADGSTDLALAPEELGKVRLKMKPDAGNPDRMVVMITFERPETLELFRRHAGELADALRSAGYAGADIGFGQEGSFASGSDRRESSPGLSSGGALRAEPSDITSPPARLLAGASLDLRL